MSRPPVPTGSPTLAVVNARVWTGDARRPWADAIAAVKDRISAVGSSAEIKKGIVPSTRVIDARGRMIVPGRVDSLVAIHAAVTNATSDIAALTRGSVADFVVLDRDITRIDAAELRDARVDLTVVDGDVVFERGTG